MHKKTPSHPYQQGERGGIFQRSKQNKQKHNKNIFELDLISGDLIKVCSPDQDTPSFFAELLDSLKRNVKNKKFMRRLWYSGPLNPELY